jgi:hypothetical protein
MGSRAGAEAPSNLWLNRSAEAPRHPKAIQSQALKFCATQGQRNRKC